MIKYTKEKTTFLIYSPYTSEVYLCLFSENDEVIRKEKMVFKEKEYYEVTINEDLEYARYKFEIGGVLVLDPDAIASYENSKYSSVIDLEKTKIKDFERINTKNENVVIYEMSVRDFTIDSNKKGKYLGVIEDKKIEYLKKLGVTHVEFLPFYDFSEESVDELDQFKKYNWGYDPVNYNVPEGSYSTDPKNPYTRIIELKEMINTLHKNGFKVIMDVVYNHIYKIEQHFFGKIIPKKAIRYYDENTISNGSGCGNDVRTEDPYVSQYIVESVKYWSDEYKIDGFRFDLMGLIDVETMKKIREVLPSTTLILGEGWSMNTAYHSDNLSTQMNAHKLPNIAFFSDDTRNIIRGNGFTKYKGFIQGNGHENSLADAIRGCKGFKNYVNPKQVVHYIEAHDDHTLYDFITHLDSNLEETVKYRMASLGSTIILVSQGIVFIHAGQEFYRTKQGVCNSYNKNDDINKWDNLRCEKYLKNIDYISELIKFRKESNLFNYETYEEVYENVKILKTEYNEVVFRIKDYLFILKNNGNTDNIKEYLKQFNITNEIDILFANFEKTNSKDYALHYIDAVILKLK